MTTVPAPAPFLAEVARRIAINEGDRLTRYQDSLGIWTIGRGFNLERGDGAAMLASVGASWSAVCNGGAITEAQSIAIFEKCFSGIEDAARASLAPGVYDALSDARRFVIADLEYNLGQRGWLGFTSSRAIISEAQAAKSAGKLTVAHGLFNVAGDHLAASAWDGQVGNRASRDIAMLRSGVWCNATGDGSS